MSPTVSRQELDAHKGSYRRADACPKRDQHRPGSEPFGYLEWHLWAARKSRTHDQVRCDGCGLYVIWRRRRSS